MWKCSSREAATFVQCFVLECHAIKRGSMVWPLISRLTAGVLKSFTGVAKDATSIAKDTTSIRKDIVETKLAEIELQQKQSSIQLATFQDVKEFDPKYSAILDQAKVDPRHIVVDQCRSVVILPFFVLGLLVLITIASLTIRFLFTVSFIKAVVYGIAIVLVPILLLIAATVLYFRIKDGLRKSRHA